MSDSDNQIALPNGSRIVFYKLIEKLGQGAFGMTYLALDQQRNRPVVLKEYFPGNAAVRTSGQTQVSLLSANKQDDFDEGLRRFRREAQVLSEFDHPNVVKVIGLFDANNTAYFVMEHIDGQSLEDLLQSRGHQAFTDAEIQRNFLPILDGLDAIHKTELLHLDIKPDNILTSKYGQPLLIDFGGARYATGQASQDHSSMVATHGYAPPEQYSLKQQQTAATDIYAVGITLYHLMAPGVEIPDSKDRQTAFQDELPDPLPSIREVAKGYPEPLYQTVEACTRLSKVKRPQSIAEVKHLLQGVLDSGASVASAQLSEQASEQASPKPQSEARDTPQDAAATSSTSSKADNAAGVAGVSDYSLLDSMIDMAAMDSHISLKEIDVIVQKGQEFGFTEAAVKIYIWEQVDQRGLSIESADSSSSQASSQVEASSPAPARQPPGDDSTTTPSSETSNPGSAFGWGDHFNSFHRRHGGL